MMTDRHERTGRPAAISAALPVEHDQPAVIIVPYRPGGHSARLLPPILLVLLGAAFLAYRARSPDWRGASALFESRPKLASIPNPARAAEPPARVAEPAPTVPEAKPVASTEFKRSEDPREREKGAKPAGPKREVDPLEDIRREAETTRQRMAELEGHKEREARKLDETADERQRADRIDRRFRPRFRAGQVAPEQVEKMLREQGEQLRRQMDLMALRQRRQMEQMASMQRGLFPDHGPTFYPPPPLPLPRFPADPGPFRPAPAGGMTRLHEFRGPDGTRVFRFQFRRGGGPPADEDPPPPPPPPRKFD